ncbi:MAG: hypothetical protein KGL22_05330, partial [Alphaproteobacteria bacterium]|nr:hypothetical protein [Alphaproteobacteria bacterium]
MAFRFVLLNSDPDDRVVGRRQQAEREKHEIHHDQFPTLNQLLWGGEQSACQPRKPAARRHYFLA